MNPIHFPESNKNLLPPSSMTKDECGELPIFTDRKICISKWKMSWRERWYAFRHGHVWLYVYSGETQPPVAMTTQRTVFEKTETKHDEIKPGFMIGRLARIKFGTSRTWIPHHGSWLHIYCGLFSLNFTTTKNI